MKSCEKYVSRSSEYFPNTPGDTAKALFFYPTVIGGFDYRKGYDLFRNHFDSFLLILIESGNIKIMLNGKELSATAGNAVLIDCYKPHGYTALEDTRALWLHFDGPVARAYYEHIAQENGNVITPSDFKGLWQKMNRLFMSFKSGEYINEAKTSLTITEMLHVLLNKGGEAPVSEGVKKAAAFISKHYPEKIGLKEIAAEAGFSPFYFSRIFKEETGLTPHQYIISARISAARFELSATRLSVAEIASSCGFTDASAFCLCFRQYEGVTPSEFRRMGNV
ncbi:MAG: helix-turn-helix transcriptional regulator [Lachnospiraceae bacterium]|nr:helix-turn-helix transcriptional regulator [Lachnospiraceae bacterium]